MKFLKKLTLLSVMLGIFGVNNSSNTVFAGNFDLKLYTTINRAVKTGIVDFTIFNTDKLTKQECSRMLAYVTSVKQNPLMKINCFNLGVLEDIEGHPLFLLLNKSEVNDNESEEKGDEKKFRADRYFKKNLQGGEKENSEVIIKYPFASDSGDKYIRRQIMKTIDTAYDCGYIDFTQLMNFFESAPSLRCKTISLYASLFELDFNLEISKSKDYLPIKIIISKDSDVEEEGEISQIYNLLNENDEKRFEFTTKKECKKEYMTLLLKYAEEKNIIDLTAIDFDSMADDEISEFGDKLMSFLSEETHVIYYNDSAEYYSKLGSREICNAIVTAVPKDSRHGIDLERKHKIMEQIIAANETGSIVLDEISLPAISKICFEAFKKANGDKEEKLKVKLYADMNKHKELKQILDEDPNIEINYGAFDGGLYEEVQRILTNAIEPNGSGINFIDYSKLPLKDCRTVGLLDLVKACSEYFLLNHPYEKRIELEVPYSKKTEAKDEEIMEDFSELEEKYGNLVVIRNTK